MAETQIRASRAGSAILAHLRWADPKNDRLTVLVGPLRA